MEEKSVEEKLVEEKPLEEKPVGEKPVEETKTKKKDDLDKIIQRNLFKEFSNTEIEELGLDSFNLNLKNKTKKKKKQESNYWRNRNDVN